MLITLKTNLCLKCKYEWTKRAKTSIQCPNCGTRKWFEPDTVDKYFEMFGQRFALIAKELFGKMTHVKYSLDPTGFKDKDYFSMYDITFLSLETKEIFLTWTSKKNWEELQKGKLSYTQISEEFYDVIKAGLQSDNVEKTLVKCSLTKTKYIDFEMDKKTKQFLPLLSDYNAW